MDNEDARRLSPAEQYERRRQVIRAYKRKLNKAQICATICDKRTEQLKIATPAPDGDVFIYTQDLRLATCVLSWTQSLQGPVER